MPFRDDSFSEILARDVIEHIPAWKMPVVLLELNRVLELGGVIRGVTPNPDSIMRQYANGEISLYTAITGLYGWAIRPYEQHYVTYTMGAITRLFAHFGFSIDDYSESPGPEECPWWIIFRGTKIADVKVAPSLAPGIRAIYQEEQRA